MSAIPALAIHDGRPMADSRDVAATFARNHKDVLRAYREAHCSAEFRQRNFAPFKTNDLTGETLSHVLMTKNGFSFLVLGFTGAEAGVFKEGYIERFDAMEVELAERAPARIDVRDPAQLAAIAGQLIEVNRELTIRAETAETTLSIAGPKAEALDRIADTTGLINTTIAAKTLGKRPCDLVEHMLGRGWAYRAKAGGRLVGRQDKLNAHLLEHKAVPIAEGRTVSQLYVTPRGLTRLAQELGVALTVPDDLFSRTPPPAGSRAI